MSLRLTLRDALESARVRPVATRSPARTSTRRERHCGDAEETCRDKGEEDDEYANARRAPARNKTRTAPRRAAAKSAPHASSSSSRKSRSTGPAVPKSKSKKGAGDGGRRRGAAPGDPAPGDSAPSQVKPKRALTAYIYFCMEERLRLANELPNLSFKETGVELGMRWKNLDARDKAPYIRLAARDKTRAESERARGSPATQPAQGIASVKRRAASKQSRAQQQQGKGSGALPSRRRQNGDDDDDDDDNGNISNQRKGADHDGDDHSDSSYVDLGAVSE